MARVIVGLSGGVDSSVAAYLLKQQGHEVIGIFMRNWNDASPTLENECPWIEDSRDAMLVAEHLGIPFQLVDFSAEYLDRIVNYMFDEYAKGRTPNPDILCNREIKFYLFLKEALKLKADYIATGHYVRKGESKINNHTVYHLLKGKDSNKNQSYFLAQLSQEQLSKSLFPIGELEKSRVREIALEIGLPTATKKDSQGLCFIGHVKLPTFLQQQLKTKEGLVVEIPKDTLLKNDSFLQPLELTLAHGQVVGKHQGAHFYTIGQRKGLHIGGKTEPLFVLQTNVKENIVFVGQGENHPLLWHLRTFIDKNEAHWVRPDMELQINETQVYMVQIRYRQDPFEAKITRSNKGLEIAFEQPQKSVAKGQFAAWFLGDELIGSGVMS